MDYRLLEVSTMTQLTKMSVDHEEDLSWIRESVRRELKKAVEAVAVETRK